MPESGRSSSEAVRNSAPVVGHDRPLCVDLDGTLIATDLFVETVLYHLRFRPLSLIAAPWWLVREGKAGLKRRLAKLAHIDPATLPYRPVILAFVKKERAKGRTLILATASDELFARAVAKHLNVFDQVLSSDGKTNLKAGAKLLAIRAVCTDGFDYIGDSAADLPLLEAATQAYLVAPRQAVRTRSESLNPTLHVFPTSTAFNPRVILRMLRPERWARNLLLLVPAMIAHEGHNTRRSLDVGLGIVCFSLCTSSIFVARDILNVQDDRHHPSKCQGPMASCILSLSAGSWLFASLMLTAFLPAMLLLRGQFVVILASHFVLGIVYSVYVRSRLLVAVMVLPGFYALRLMAGSAAASVEIPPWLLVSLSLLFLSLALVERNTEELNEAR